MAYRSKHIHSKIRQSRPKKKLMQQLWFRLAVLIAIFLVILSYVAFWLSPLQVAAVEISGNQKVPAQDIRNIAEHQVTHKILFFPTRSIFLVNTGSIAAALARQFPDIGSVSVAKKYLNSLVIVVQERKPAAVFCNQQCYLIDANGVLFEKAEGQGEGVKITTDQQTADTLGSTAISKSTMAMIQKVAQNLQSQFQINITEALVSNPLVLKTSEGWSLYLDPTSSIDDQLLRMDALFKNKITDTQRAKLQYLYLQYKDRAFYK